MAVNNHARRDGKRRVHHFAQLKLRGEKIVMVTAYDYPTGLAADAGGADIVLVGDSLGMVALGYDDTIPVTLSAMEHHTAAVHRAVKRAFLVADLPFLTYKVSPEQAVENAGRLMQNGGCEGVKLEGGREILPMVERVVAAGIPVVGHLGLLPQSVHRHGGYRVQGRESNDASKMLEDARALEAAGAFAVVLEAVTPEAAGEVTAALSIPTIGIGAGRACDGQVLVCSDLAGMLPHTPAKFVKRYVDVFGMLTSAVELFGEDVRNGSFPDERHEY